MAGERPIVAERNLYAIAPDGREFDLTIRINQPYQSDESWACSVAVIGLCDRLRDIHGVDSMQALHLALRLAAQLIDDFVESGGKLYWERGGESVLVNKALPFV